MGVGYTIWWQECEGKSSFNEDRMSFLSFSFSFVLDYLFRVFLQSMAPWDLVDVTWIKEKKSYLRGGQRSECLWRVDFGFTKIEWRLEWGKIRKPRLIDESSLSAFEDKSLWVQSVLFTSLSLVFCIYNLFVSYSSFFVSVYRTSMFA